MTRIFFSPNQPGRVPTALAQACGYNPDAVARDATAQACLREVHARGKEYWSAAATLDEADVAVWTYGYAAEPEILRFLETARAARKPCLMFDYSDSSQPLPAPYGTLYRYSVDADRQLPHERAMPGLCQDVLEVAGLTQLPIRKKSDRPSVGFCGYVDRGPKVLIRRLMGQREKVAAHLLRAGMLDSFARDPAVQCNFIERRQFSGGALAGDAGQAAAARKQFIDNLLESDYIACARGAGNFSLRFYEALSLGRIPVLLSTQSVLPLDDTIEWKKHCLIVDERDMSRLPEKLRAFHGNLSPDEFENVQRQNRRLWDEQLKPLSFLRRILERAMAQAT